MPVIHPQVPSPPVGLRFEHHQAGALGIGEARPRLSWHVASAPEDYEQSRYEVAASLTAADGSTESFGVVVESGEQVLVPWPVRPLRSRERATVRLRVQGTSGGWSGWSAPGTVEAGLLTPSDWCASLVTPTWPEDPDTDRRPPLLRTDFVVPAAPRSARLYVTAHGLAEVEINGTRVGADALLPGWTSYHQRLRYYTYDVTDALVTGENAVGAWMGDGWFRGRIGFEGGNRNLYGSRLGLLVQLEIVTADGERITIGTGPGWRAAVGPIVTSGLYDGEHYDARALPHGWSEPGFDDSTWTPVTVDELDPSLLAAPVGPPVRCMGTLEPVDVERRGEGRYLLDFGQNHSGRLRLRTTGQAGATIRLRHAEVLEDGDLCTRPLREAAATDVLIMGDDGPAVWEPRFTMHGFRYAEVSGWSGDLSPGDVVSRVYHSDMERLGHFSCSEPDVDRLHENVVWSTRSNFLDIPTDCPQRDERLGWTGDIQVFTPTASFLYDTAGMLGDWLVTLAQEQEQYGTVPWYVPFVPGGWWDPTVAGAVWGDAAVLTPWALYERYADAGVLERQYASACAWVDQVQGLAGPDLVWDQGRQLGDWLDPSAPPDDPGAARTDPHLVATAYFARSARVLAEMAGVLGRTDDHRRYSELAQGVRAAFARRYLHPDGTATSDTQTAYALAVVFDLVPDALARRRAVDRLAELVDESGGTIATGFAGTPVVCDALTLGGHLESAYRLLLERRCPSWLYPVTMGATTVWERWDSLLPDGTVNPGDMTSFNHYALGAVADWLHRVVAGLAPAAPGYRVLRLAPRPGGGITRAEARHRTPYGEAAISWTTADGRLDVTATVPVGTRAVVDLPSAAPVTVGHGTHTFTVPADDVDSGSTSESQLRARTG